MRSVTLGSALSLALPVFTNSEKLKKKGMEEDQIDACVGAYLKKKGFAQNEELQQHAANTNNNNDSSANSLHILNRVLAHSQYITLSLSFFLFFKFNYYYTFLSNLLYFSLGLYNSGLLNLYPFRQLVSYRRNVDILIGKKKCKHKIAFFFFSK